MLPIGSEIRTQYVFELLKSELTRFVIVLLEHTQHNKKET